MDKKIRTSKIIMWLFISVFIITVIACICILIVGSKRGTYIDTAIICAVLTAAVTPLGICLCSYYNASKNENIPKIELALYKEAMEIRFDYNKRMAKLKDKYNLDGADIADFENQTNIDEVTDNILNQTVSELSGFKAESHRDVTAG